MIEFVAKLIGTVALAALLKLVIIPLCGYLVTWRLSLLIAASWVFSA